MIDQQSDCELLAHLSGERASSPAQVRPPATKNAGWAIEPVEAAAVAAIDQWFHAYSSRNIRPGGAEGDEAKRQTTHARNVRTEAILLGADLGLDAAGRELAGLLGLLHDIGHFEWHPPIGFLDQDRSAEQAELGLTLLERDGVLESLPSQAQDIIRQSILRHGRGSDVRQTEEDNREEAEAVRFYTRLLKDADRMDNWRMALQEYQQVNGHRNPIVRHHLPETPGCSLAVREPILTGRSVDPYQVRNLNDLHLLQLSWVFDLQFEPTVLRVRARHIVSRLRLTLHGCGDTTKLFAAATAHLASWSRPQTPRPA